ncbi:MAG: DMT family transporter [Betaproteobacteria bacterium]|jgi:drug/metabolite transporter (DMT)-like permease|nr:DMT family transporter [Betaproteobacteria bacterium]NDD23024.1 DMT family transporter [Betaproteobacteria bacterium]NDF79384.1 DMT family transporter [Betaproteobacteria bacterium]
MWSVNYVIAKTAPGVISPHVLALGRWFLAGLILAALSHRELWRERRHTLKVWPQYLVLGTLGMLICGAWVYWAAETTTAINIALIYAASPVLITLGAVLGLKERFSWRQGLGVALALLGVLNVVVKGQWATLSQVVWVLGDGLVVFAMVAWAAYALLLKKWASPLSSTARLAATCMGGSLVLLPFALTEWLTTQHATWSGMASWLVIAAALFPGVGAYWAYGFCQKTLGASRVAASLYMGPLYGSLVAWLFLGETLGWHHAVGAAMILPGIYLASQKPVTQ